MSATGELSDRLLFFVICCYLCVILAGGVAQLGEHNVRNVGVRGSNPLTSTNFRAKVKEVEEAKKK